LSQAQSEYAAGDVLYLHRLKEILDERLEREGRLEMALATMDFIPTRALLDIEGWPQDVFAHNS
jgi:ribonuclease D